MSDIVLKFDPNQQHQLDAVENSVSLFSEFSKTEVVDWFGGDIVPNLPEFETFDEEWLLSNLNKIQEKYNEKKEGNNKIELSSLVEFDSGLELNKISNNSWRYPQFTIEMETGTGKTYVYLRTIHELKKQYGFRKFIVIVPSIAIYEGTIKAYEITKEHFKTLYENEPITLSKYDGQQLSNLRGYATSQSIEILVMTIDSFNKSKNIIYKPSEKLQGELLPYEYIQGTRPILILDECQNYETEIAKSALRTLHPLFALRYSATPTQKPNQIYRLSPVDAFKMNLVKRIQVFGIKEAFNYNQQIPLISESIDIGKYGIRATMRVLINENGVLGEKVIEVKKGDDLFKKTKNDNYKGVIVEEIDRGAGLVIFTNTNESSVRDISAFEKKEDIFRKQIHETIKQHFETQNRLKEQGIKVLSLFFVDRVANYTNEKGLIKRLFDEEFDKLKKGEELFEKLNPDEVREAYFAKKKLKGGVEVEVDTPIEDQDKKNEDKESEKAAYELIMKKKERLLTFDEKVSFIFAHSALKEGWDNPNVFQICTLNATVSENKKRQEIGRGLRLCVNQKGDRVTDEDVNILTVIANESYEEYVNSLQREYIDSGDAEPPPPSNARKTDARRNDAIFKNKDFQDFWDKLCQSTSYEINLDADELVSHCVSKLKDTYFPEPRIIIEKGKYVMTQFAFKIQDIDKEKVKIKIDITDTDNQSNSIISNFKRGNDIAKLTKDERLRGFKILEIVENGDESYVEFDNGKILYLGEELSFDTQDGQRISSRTESETQTNYPVFNIIDRASKETSLTRKTLLKIFKGIAEDKKEAIFKNPEGFSGIFITTIDSLLADHIAKNIEYKFDERANEYDIKKIFPKLKKYPQKELIVGTATSLYDQIQYDSEVEKRFIEHRLKTDDKIICYFKFPNSFKIKMPKIIGNYVPDWGVIRWDDDNKIKLELVRETKGTMNKNLLQWPHEKRKIDCATKHFESIGVDYKQVDDTATFWWK